MRIKGLDALPYNFFSLKKTEMIQFEVFFEFVKTQLIIKSMFNHVYEIAIKKYGKINFEK